MTRYLLKRISIALAILLAMSSLLFLFSRTEDPRYQLLTEYMSGEQWEALGDELGLNRPLVVQYVVWIADSTRIGFGDSPRRSISARKIALEYTTATLRLLAGGLAFSVIFSAGSILAILYIGQRGPHLEYIGRSARVIVPAIPPFMPAILLAHIFYPHSLLFPLFRDGAWSYLLPSAALGVVIAYVVVRLFDTARKDAANSGYTLEKPTTDTGPDVARPRPIAWHMLLSLLRSSRVYVPVLLAAIIFTELIFDMRGLSNIIFSETLIFDFPLASSAFMILTMAYVVVMLLMDVARAFVDPLVRSGSSDAPVTDSGLVAGVRAVPSGVWPLFGRRPVFALAILGMVVLFSILVPFIVSYPYGITRPDGLYIIFLNLRYALATLAFALIAAAMFGAVAALMANRFGGVIGRLLVWVFDLLTAFPILLLGLAGYVVWSQSLTGQFLFRSTPIFIQASTYPACLLAVIVSGMFFNRVRTDARMANGREGVFNRDVAKGILMVAALSAGPLVMLSAIFDAAGVWAYGWGWGGPIGRLQYSLVSIWWTLLAGLVLILTVLSLNFLGAWLRERFDPQPNLRQDDAAEAPA